MPHYYLIGYEDRLLYNQGMGSVYLSLLSSLILKHEDIDLQLSNFAPVSSRHYILQQH